MCGDAAAAVTPEESNEKDIGDCGWFPKVVCIRVQESMEKRGTITKGANEWAAGVRLSVPWQADVLG